MPAPTAVVENVLGATTVARMHVAAERRGPTGPQHRQHSSLGRRHPALDTKHRSKSTDDVAQCGRRAHDKRSRLNSVVAPRRSDPAGSSWRQ